MTRTSKQNTGSDIMTAVIAFTAKARNTGTKLKNVDRLVFYKYAEKGDIPFKKCSRIKRENS